MAQKRGRLAAAIALTILGAASANAQVPQDIEAKLRELGRVIAPAETARLYRPLFANGPPPGVAVARDLAFGPDPKQRLNVYSPPSKAPPRPVLIFVPGGLGLKQIAGPEGEPFYDNIGAWGVKHGLVVLTTQYRTGASAAWDDGARDVASTIQWAKANVTRYGGDPAEIVILGQSNGVIQLATYLGHPELQPHGGSGVKAAILMSGAFNILPVRLKSPPARRAAGADGPAPVGLPGGGPPPIDPQVMLQRSNLPGLKAHGSDDADRQRTRSGGAGRDGRCPGGRTGQGRADPRQGHRAGPQSYLRGALLRYARHYCFGACAVVHRQDQMSPLVRTGWRQ
jgi:hypothetical protein